VADRVLTLREINRAMLSRQLLLERSPLAIPQAIESLIGLQAQSSAAPFIGLWTRLRDFHREDLARLIDDHSIVKATLMRATLHLSTAEDYLQLRATLQPVLTQASDAISRGRGAGFDVEKVIDAARKYIAEKPRSFADISAMLTELMPDTDVGAMRYTVRTHLPLVQVPISGGWSYPGNPQFALAEKWLDKPVPRKVDVSALVLRYLAAFGPASATDMQTWSGLPKLKDVFEKLKPRLKVYRDEQGRELFDLPEMEARDGDTPAPERFLPEFDNILLSHSKRTRIIAEEYRSKVFLPGLRVRPTFLVDGFVRGGWKVEKSKGTATIVLEPFDKLTRQNRASLGEEAERLVRFVERDAKGYDVRFAE